jgi:hypothetical protein
MEDLKTSIGQLKDHASEYVKTYVDLAKVKATKGASNAAAGAAIGIVSFLLAFFFIEFLFIGLALWVGTLVDSTAGGFLIVAGVFLLLIILIVALRKKVIVPMIRNSIIRKVYE